MGSYHVLNKCYVSDPMVGTLVISIFENFTVALLVSLSPFLIKLTRSATLK